MAEFQVQVLTEADKPAVIEHLRAVFCVHEPIFLSHSISPDEHFMEANTAMIDSGISLKAVNADGKVIGLLLSAINERKTVSCASSLRVSVFQFFIV